MTKRFFEATVLQRRALAPGMVRVSFGGEGLLPFVSTGIGDEYLRLFFPDPETGELVLPIIDENGRWTYPEGKPPVRCSTYTVRRFDAERQQIDIDFVVHEGGMASEWAQRSQPGDRMVINSPRGLYTPPADIGWQLLIADATGLPAISRLLEQAPAGLVSRVFIEVARPEDKITLPHHPKAIVTWVTGSGNGQSPSRLDEIVRSVPLPPEPGYIWVAGEQKAVRSIRKFVRHDLKLAPERYEIVAYWIDKQNEWNAAWDALDPAVRTAIDAAWSSERDPEEIRDEVDATLERLGL